MSGKVTRVSTTKDFIEANIEKGFDQIALDAVEAGLFSSNGLARDWMRYVIRTHNIPNIEITTSSRRGRKAVPVISPEEQKKLDKAAKAKARRAAAKKAAQATQ